MHHIDDPADPRLDDYRQLTDAAARRAIEATGAAHGMFVVEGPIALEQLRASTHRVRSVLVSTSRAATLHDRLVDLDPVYVADRQVLAAVTGYDVHRGVLAVADRPAPTPPEVLLERHQRLLLLEGVTDNENVGALFRTAAALGVEAVIMDTACADPLYRRSIRVSSGWTMRLPHARTRSAVATVHNATEHGFRCVALTPAPDALNVDVASSSGLLDDPVAFVLGAEGPGLSTAAIAACDVSVRVPMAADVDSLNVATALAVVAAFAGAPVLGLAR